MHPYYIVTLHIPFNTYKIVGIVYSNNCKDVVNNIQVGLNAR